MPFGAKSTRLAYRDFEPASMKRRQLLGAGLALAGAALTDRPAVAAAVQRTRPGMPGWPSDADWDALMQATGGRLSPVALPDLAGRAVQHHHVDAGSLPPRPVQAIGEPFGQVALV